jgi:transcriptional regulator GlxA family with amidase domain
MHQVAVVAMDDVLPFELSIPGLVFPWVRLADGETAYQVRICAERERVRTGSMELVVPWDLAELEHADTVIVPGMLPWRAPFPAAILDALRAASARGARIASICTGVFVLAQAGLLGGRRATTHWSTSVELAERYPNIQVDPDVLFVDEGQILSSAGSAAGIDLCLHLIRRDYGAAAAAAAARWAVVPMERGADHSPLLQHAPPQSDASLAPLLRWMEEHLDRPLLVDELARHASVSTRTLNRRFREQTGTTPLQWLLITRIRRAQQFLETTDLSVEQIALQVGFASATTFRDRFSRSVGTNPTAYRRGFSEGRQMKRAR